MADSKPEAKKYSIVPIPRHNEEYRYITDTFTGEGKLYPVHVSVEVSHGVYLSWENARIAQENKKGTIEAVDNTESKTMKKVPKKKIGLTE